MNTRSIVLNPDEVVAATRAWIERAVIGLNFCPFAKAVYVKDQIRYAVRQAQNSGALLDDLERELRILAQAAPQVVDTTLLIHPQVLTEFLDYNDLLAVGDAAIEGFGLAGEEHRDGAPPRGLWMGGAGYRFAGRPQALAADRVQRCAERAEPRTVVAAWDETAALPAPSLTIRCRGRRAGHPFVCQRSGGLGAPELCR